MVICTGQGAQTILVKAGKYGFASHKNDHGDKPQNQSDICAFAGVVAQNMPDTPFLVSPFPVSIDAPLAPMVSALAPAASLKPWLSQAPPIS